MRDIDDGKDRYCRGAWGVHSDGECLKVISRPFVAHYFVDFCFLVSFHFIHMFLFFYICVLRLYLFHDTSKPFSLCVFWKFPQKPVLPSSESAIVLASLFILTENIGDGFGDPGSGGVKVLLGRLGGEAGRFAVLILSPQSIYAFDTRG